MVSSEDEEKPRASEDWKHIPFPEEQYLVIPVDVTVYHKDAMRKP